MSDDNGQAEESNGATQQAPQKSETTLGAQLVPLFDLAGATDLADPLTSKGLAADHEQAALSTPGVRDLHRRTTKGFVWTLTQSVGSRLLSTFVFVVLARVLAPSAFGVVALASVFVIFLRLLVHASYTEALVQLKEIDKADYDTVFWTGLITGAGLMAALIGAAPYLALLLHQPDLTWVLRAMSVALIITALGSGQEAQLQRELNFRSLAGRSMMASVAASAVGLALALSGAGVWALVGQMIALSLGSTTALWLASGYRPGAQFSLSRLRRILRTSLSMLASAVLIFATQRSDDLMVGVRLGAHALGLYSVAHRLLLLLLDVLATSVETVAFPTVARLQDEASRLRNGIARMNRLSATIAMPSFLLVGVVSPELVRIAFGPVWVGSVPVMRVLALFGALQVTLQLNTSVLNGIGRSSTALGINLINTVTAVCAFAVAAQYGIFWVAVALTARGYLLFPVSLLAVRRHTGAPLGRMVIDLARPFFCSCVAAATCLLVQGAMQTLPDVLRLLVVLALGTVIYFLLMLLVARSFLLEILQVANSLRRAPRRPIGRHRAV